MIAVSAGLSSCQSKCPITEEEVASKPDSALTLLLDIEPASLTTARSRADYALFLSMALDKCYIDIASDTIVAPAVQYYEHHRPIRNQLLTAYYHGRVLYNGGEIAGAVRAFERAEILAKELKDDFYLGLIYRNYSLLYEYTYNMRKTIESLEEARDAFNRAGAVLYETSEVMALASALGSDGRHTESITLFDELLTDPRIDSLLKRGMYLNFARELVKADTCHRKAITLFEMGNIPHYGPTDYAAWAYCCYKVGNVQEGKKLLETSISQVEDNDTRATVAFYQYKCALIEGHEKEALSFLETAMEGEDRIAREKLAESVDDARSAYAREVLAAKEARMKRVKRVFYTCLLLALAALCYSILRRRRQQREAMARMDEIQTSLDSSVERNKSLVNAILAEQVDALRLVSDEYENSSGAFTKEHYFHVFKNRLDEFRHHNADLSLLESSVNAFRDNAMALLREEFPDETKYFYRLAAMLFAGLPYDLMSLLTKTSVPTLKSGKSKLKKKISESQTPHRELFLSLLDSAEKRPAGRPPKKATPPDWIP